MPALALLLFLVTPAAAQIAGRPLEISGQGGYFFYDSRAYMKDDPAWGGTLGWRPYSLLRAMSRNVVARGSSPSASSCPCVKAYR